MASGSCAARRWTVRLHVGQSLDGKIWAPDLGRRALGGPLDRRAVLRQRAWADVIVLGAGTVRQADVPPPYLPASTQRLRLARGQAKQPLLVVLSRRGDVPTTAKIFAAASAPEPAGHRPQVWLVTGAQPSPAARQRLEGLATFVPLPARPGDPEGATDRPQDVHEVAIARLLARLRTAGHRRILVEGGGQVAWAFAQAAALTELAVTLVPCLLGGKGRPTPVDGAGFRWHARQRLRLRSLRQRGGLLFLRYRVVTAAVRD